MGLITGHGTAKLSCELKIPQPQIKDFPQMLYYIAVSPLVITVQ